MEPGNGENEVTQAPEPGPLEVRRWEPWLAFLLSAAAYLALAWRVLYVHGRADWEVVAASARAYDAACAGQTLNLSLMGFAQPPLPVILQLPVVYAAPHWVTEAFAAPLVSALVGALAIAAACRLLRETGVHAVLAWLLLIWLGASTPWLAACITGSPLALVGLFAVAAAFSMLRWSRERSLRDLILCGLAIAAAPMAAFEAVALPLAAGVVVLIVLWRSPRQPHELQGTLITLLLPAAYVIGGWLLLCWVLLGDPLYSVRQLPEPAAFSTTAGLQFLVFAALLAVAWLSGSQRLARVEGSSGRGVISLFMAVWFVALIPTSIAVVGRLHPGQPAALSGYALLEPATEPGDLQRLRDVAEHAAVAAGPKRVLVDADLDFAVRLLSGHPKTFVTVREAKQEMATGAELLEVVSYVVTDRGKPDRLKPLLAGHTLHRLWQQQGWRFYDIRRPASATDATPTPHPQ